jgi:hypothetical protein
MNNSINISEFRPEVNNHSANFQKLAELSKLLKPEVSEDRNLKQVLTDLYSEGKQDIEFKAASQWKQEGYAIKKNMKAFLFWGSPKKSEGPDGKIRNYYPVVYLFSSNQVKKAK